ncbi:MAG: hypothetical protein ISS82_02825 [Nanoarchaeota archaeon]|nr:hypothetical protein [Nanoarchaeota archaeon]
MLSLYNKLTNSKIFKEWKENNKKDYLSSYVSINNIPQFDFYNPKTDKITSFIINKEIEIKKEQNIFKSSKDKIKELNLNKIKITQEQAEKIINNLEKYKHETFSKKIIILQNIKVPLWNISLITDTFNILNIKINAINGNIISENYESLLNFKVKK